MSTSIIVVSGFELLGEGAGSMSLAELDRQLASRFGQLYRGFVYYSPSESAWRTKLETMLIQILDKVSREYPDR